MNEEQKELIEALADFHVGLFSERESLREAYDDAMKMINSIEGSDRIVALTALHIVTNTIAKIAKETIS